MKTKIRQWIVQRNKIRQKFIFYPAIFSSLLFASIIIGSIYLNLFIPKKAYAAITNYYSIANGDWGQQIWSGTSNTGPSCSCSPTCNLSVPAQIVHKVSVNMATCNKVNISGGVNVDVINGGSLHIFGDFDISGGSTLYIGPGDTLLIDGKSNLSGGSNIIVDGYFICTEIKLSGNSTVCGNGQGYHTDKISGSGWCFTGTLSIELAYFKATANKFDKVDLDWETKSEINNGYFDIERSIDGKNFESIHKMEGAGNSTIDIYYQWTDENPLDGYSYYRLRQTDFDGTSTLSNIELVKIKSGKQTITFYPNPLQIGQQLKLKIVQKIDDCTLRIYDINGSEILKHDIKSKSWNESILIDLDYSKMISGVYIFRIDNESDLIISGKLIVR